MQKKTKPTKGGPAPQLAGKSRNARRRQNRRQRIGQIQSVPRLSAGLSECSEAYLRALAMPFGEFPEPPCIPDTITIPSNKFSTVVRGSFSAGTAGVGWVAFDPWRAVINDGAFTGSASTFPILYTTTAFTQSTYTWFVSSGAPTTGVAGANATSPWAVNYLLSGANRTQYRLVGAGLRVMYSGTELNRGGRLILVRSRLNSDIPRGAVAADFLQDPAVHQSPVTKSWKEVTYIPSNPDMLGYQDAITYVNAGSQDYYTLLAFVDGTTAANSFAFEAIAHYEMVGARQPVTASHADPVGFGAIMSSIPQVIKENGSTMFNTMKNLALEALKTSVSGLLPGFIRPMFNAAVGIPRITNG